MSQLFDDELNQAMQQLFDETIEVIQLAKASPDLDDLAATFAVALLKLGLATGFVEQKNPASPGTSKKSASASLRRCRTSNSRHSSRRPNTDPDNTDWAGWERHPGPHSHTIRSYSINCYFLFLPQRSTGNDTWA